MKFLVDAQLPPSLADWLRSKGGEANHVEDVGLHAAEDVQIRTYAEQASLIVVTKDRDFLPASLPDTLQVLWVRTGNSSNVALFSRFEANWVDVVRYLEAGTRLVELR